MERDWPEDPQTYNRLDTDLSTPDPADTEDDATDAPRRDRISAVIDEVEPERARVPNEAVYGDTDLNPNRADQLDAHRGEGNTV